VSKEQHTQKRNEHEPQVQLHETEGKTDRGEGGGHGEERLVHDDHAEKRQRIGRDETFVHAFPLPSFRKTSELPTGSLADSSAYSKKALAKMH
jgi:hypothetical protein